MNTMFTIEENMKMNSIDQIKMQLTFKTWPWFKTYIVNAWNVGELDQMVLPPYNFPILHKRVEFWRTAKIRNR
jgi:thymidylate synthase